MEVELTQQQKSFTIKLNSILQKRSTLESVFTSEQYDEVIEDLKIAIEAKKKKIPLTTKQYRRLKRFDILVIGGVEKLICVKSKTDFKYFVKAEECFDIIHDTHIAIGHKRLRAMEYELKKKYCNIGRDIIEIYLQLCHICQLKTKHPRKGLVVKPIISDEMNSRCQVDLIDMQSESDAGYRFIFVYQDHLTKFVFLRPLKTKTAEEVAYNLIDIFAIIGAPMILQSDNGREFVNKVITEVTNLWPGLKIVHGKPRHSQSQGSVERANQDIRDMLIAWQEQQNTKKWSEGLRFVQFQKNRSLHSGIRRSPYLAMFGMEPKLGLTDSCLPHEILQNLETEEDLIDALSKGRHESVEDCTPANAMEISDQEQENMEIPHTHVIEDSTPTQMEIDVESSLANERELIESTGPLLLEQVESLNNKEASTSFERKEAKASLINQASKMLSFSNKKFLPGKVGQNVTIMIPDVKRLLEQVVAVKGLLNVTA